MSSESLPTEILDAIHRILNAESSQNAVDPLDNMGINGFSTSDVLNQYFPNEASLANTEQVQAQLVQKRHELQQEINELRERLKRDQDPNKMHIIQELIGELLGQMARIREKATESEAVVRNITKDIQVLDLAKRNLIQSMTTLRRLQMLVNALTQLDVLLSEKKYGDIAQTLSATKEISASFRAYISIPHVSQVLRRIQEVQGRIRSAVDADFDLFFLQDPAKPVKPSVIVEACRVVDVLGTDVRTQIIERYTVLEFKEYRRIFRTSDEAGQLDNLPRRFAWFRRELQAHENETGRIFPGEWRVGWYLLAKFVETTRDDLSSLLAKAAPTLTVTALLDHLQVAAEFENSMVKKWATPMREMLATVMQNQTGHPKTLITPFEPHMNIFINAQDKALSDMLAPHRKIKIFTRQPRASLDTSSSKTDDQDADGSSESPVLPSSTELFYFYGQSLEQCAKLSAGKPLDDLCNVHKKWLRIYADEVLMSGLKRQPASTIRRSIDSRYDPAELQRACVVMNTADYCQTTATELEEKIRETVNEEFKDQITFQIEREAFVGVVSTGINLQVRNLELASESAFASLARTSWAMLNQVTGPSAYIDDLSQAVEAFFETIKPRVEQKRYLRNFLDKASSLIWTKMTNSLVRSRPLLEIGAEQLLIDLQAIKTLLMRLPGENLLSPAYTRAVNKSASRLESLLKVIITPIEPLEGFILNYTLLVGDASFSNFQKILDLKGTPKARHSELLDAFLTITSTKDDLESTSFLSSLDMDPSATLATSLATPLPGNDIFSGLASPLPMSGPPTGGSTSNGSIGGERQVFQDFKRFVSFGLRREPGQ